MRWKIVFLALGLLTAAFIIAGLLVRFLDLDFVISAVIAVLVCLAAGYYIAGRLTRPIEHIAEMTDMLVNGDFSGEIYVRSHDEMGWLARNYNELGARLSENFSEITTEKQKLETILKQMADGMVAVNRSGRIISANDAARKMLRMSDDDVTYKHYDDIILRFTDELTAAKIKAKLNAGEHSGRYSYGGRTFEIRFDYFRDTYASEEGLVIMLQDVTERLKIDNMQTDFVANVSHELKTPLTSIKGYAETLLAGGMSDPETAYEFLSIINSETDRMNRLVKDILQMSRLDTGRLKWDIRRSDIVSLVRTAIKKMNVQAEHKGQQLNTVFDPKERIPVEMDRDKIEQVIMNIISNSVKYTKEQGRIDVSIATSGKEVRIMVMDNGIGIPEKDLPRVFERFFMVNKARSGQSVGTGLGLSISKHIVEEHGGSIEIESVFGKGTRVSVYLPLAIQEQPAAKKADRTTL
ncbi:MAG: cell wall metabolism sensor histidine kinase WalK [Clostridiales Family XIII bacterium]|jgi:two-component system sensor histidine kinase VicK|nr:cell wall metabolism sensor histidine kinase WalK [Clostridiales Family XIII bacterium]